MAASCPIQWSEADQKTTGVLCTNTAGGVIPNLQPPLLTRPAGIPGAILSLFSAYQEAHLNWTTLHPGALPSTLLRTSFPRLQLERFSCPMWHVLEVQGTQLAVTTSHSFTIFFLCWRGASRYLPKPLFSSVRRKTRDWSATSGATHTMALGLCRFLLDVRRRIPSQPAFSPKGE